MPKTKSLLPEQRMRDKFYVILENRAREQGLETNKSIAERLGMLPQAYSNRKHSAGLSAWNVEELAKIVKKFRLTGEDVMAILEAGKLA